MSAVAVRALRYACGFWLALCAYVNSDTGVSLFGLFAQLAGALVVAALVVLALSLGWRPRVGGALVPKVVAGLAVLVAVLLPPPRSPFFHARFAASRAALRDVSRALLAGNGELSSPRWIGLYRVERAGVVDGQVRFITTACGLVDACGLVFAPSGPPAPWQEDVFTPLGDGWWRVHEGF